MEKSAGQTGPPSVAYPRFATATLAFVLGTILWGAYVRATGSGAGCGAHWPLCNGDVVPLTRARETLIEFTHRLSSGLTLLLVGGLAWRTFRRYPARSAQRWLAGAMAILLVLEAALGAALVLLRLVAHDVSIARAVAIAVHLVNTLFLLGAITGVWALRGPAPRAFRPPGTAGVARAYAAATGAAALAFLLVAVAGAITALGDTLFPPTAVGELRESWPGITAAGRLLVELRVIHPFLAAVTGLGWLGYALWLKDRLPAAARAPGRTLASCHGVIALTALQLVLGVSNILLRAPVAMQIIHLLVADLLWLAFVGLTVRLNAASIALPGGARD